MRVYVESMCYGADAVAHAADGKTIFIAGGVAGDTVEAQIISEGKSFSRARVEKVVEASHARVNPVCPYANRCGGCPWANLSYEYQLQAKEKNVRDALVRIAHLSEERIDACLRPIVPSKKQWGYRNKIELAASDGPDGLRIGMHERDDPSTIFDIDTCALLPKTLQKSPKALRGALRFCASREILDISRIGVRASTRTGSCEVALWTPPCAFPRSSVSRILADALPTTSVARVLGQDGSRKISGLECLSGKGYWEEQVLSHTMRLSAPAFFQVNTDGAEDLIKTVTEGLGITPADRVADLYCGAGTFTLALARMSEADMLAIESYGPAVRDFRKNLSLGGLDTHVKVIADDTARQVTCLENIDVCVVDPPRAGLAKEVIEALNASNIHSLAYVSCDPATLARDLAAFDTSGGLQIQSITPVDLFPQSYHVECVVLMSRVNNEPRSE